MNQVKDSIRIVSGAVRDARATAFAIVKDEIYYIRSFLDHHRKLGIDQFIILDDRSKDGTRDVLVSQRDCVVVESSFTFGEWLTVDGPGPGRQERAGILFKSAIPQKFLPGRYALYLDADEYLVLPADLATVGDLFDVLARREVASVAANLIDFFPATVMEMDAPQKLDSGEAMLAAHSYFDAVPLLGWKAGHVQPQRVNDSATTRLFAQHRIKTVPEELAEMPRWLARLLPLRRPRTSVQKTPVVRWDPGVAYVNSHIANVPPTRQVLLGLAHLKFTYDLARRIEYALASKAYVRGSRKYLWYAELLDAMRRGDPSFLGSSSRQFTTSADLADAGLTQFELD